MKLKILTYPNKQLYQKSKLIAMEEIPNLQGFFDDLIETMYFFKGIGLAAVQVGNPIQVFVIGIPKEDPIICINPSILEFGTKWPRKEGCLSIPGIFEDVMRSEGVAISYLDRFGKMQMAQFSGLKAQVAIHEFEHFSGMLLIDKFNGFKKQRLIEKSAQFMLKDNE